MKMEKTISKNGEWWTEDVEISPATFKKIFGISFAEWRKSLDKTDPRKKMKFNEGFCAIDPYNEDMHGEIFPLIEFCPVKLQEEIRESVYAI